MNKLFNEHSHRRWLRYHDAHATFHSKDSNTGDFSFNITQQQAIRSMETPSYTPEQLNCNSLVHGGTTEEGNCSYLLPLSHRVVQAKEQQLNELKCVFHNDIKHASNKCTYMHQCEMTTFGITWVTKSRSSVQAQATSSCLGSLSMNAYNTTMIFFTIQIQLSYCYLRHQNSQEIEPNGFICFSNLCHGKILIALQICNKGWQNKNVWSCEYVLSYQIVLTL